MHSDAVWREKEKERTSRREDLLSLFITIDAFSSRMPSSFSKIATRENVPVKLVKIDCRGTVDKISQGQ